MKNSNISQHLARRDGELEVVSSDAGELDAELLKSLGDLKAELGNLSDVELPERDWHSEALRLSPRAGQHSSRGARILQYPLATAATVLFASALLVGGIGMDWSRDSERIELGSADLVTSSPDSLPALIARSQDLESLAQISGSWSGHDSPPTQLDTETPLTRLILMQVAAIDDRLSSLDGQADRERIRMLWQRRVNLLQAYNAAVENANPDLSRSM